ncbi:MAG TPA: CHASE3 domain-containing protein [Verrucomicrobiae bacterium]|nr:CHASE3 domain-containing protein [Verrucomicrobiae bacterium]
MVRRRFERSAPLGDLSLTAKGILVVSIPVAALLAAMAVFSQLQRQSNQAREWVEHSLQIRAGVRRAMNLLLNQETAARGYLLTRQDEFLARYFEARQSLPQQLDELTALLADNPAQTARFNHVRGLAAEAQKSWEMLRQDGGAPNAADTIAHLEAGRQQMEDLRGEVTEIQNQELVLLQSRTVAEQKAQRNLESFIFAGGIFGLLGGVVAALLFSTSIVRRVRHLEADAGRVAEGIPVDGAVGGRDEIARLGQTLGKASQLLVAREQELRAAHAELESRVRVRTAELQAANEQLSQSNAVREAVISSSPLAIWAVDLAGSVTLWSPAAERMFGWTADEVIGRPLPVIPDDARAEYREWLERFRLGLSMAAVERARQRKDGSKIEVSIWTAPIRDASGQVTGTIAIDSDVTERRQLEDQVRRSQKLEAVGRLAGGVAHDFNNLLTVILGYVEMIMLEAGNSASILDSAQEIQYAANRASALTAQLLAFSRRQISQPQVLRLNEVVEHSVKMLGRVIGEDVEIATHLDPDLGVVKVDPNQIDQVLVNLVVNARDAMPKGGKLTIETSNVVLDENYAGRHIGVSPGPYAMLAVSDNGAGMSPEVKNRLFEPFFTTKDAGRGTGLGLSIVYGIVKQNSGEILVYSEPGQGSTFKIYFPIAESAEEVMAVENGHAELFGHETILLCEDEAGIRKLVRNMLINRGYRVLEAETPHRAIEIAHKFAEPIHLLLTDVVMPHMSGFDLARELCASRPTMKVLYTSGYTDNSMTGNWVLQPGAPFLHKPFTAGSLGRKIREALAGERAAT